MGLKQIKKSRYFLRGDDRGASLIAVIVAVVFVLIITTITLEVTTANIRMRDVEASGKENFYSAEQYMDEVMHAMADIAALEVEESYTELLSRYGVVKVKGGTLQDEFQQIYMEKLEAYFLLESAAGGNLNGEEGGEADSDEDEEYFFIKHTKSDDGYAVGTYNTGLVRDAFEKILRKMKLDEAEFEKAKNYLKLNAPIFTADYNDGLFTLKNVEIVYPDQYGYETWLSADLVFKTPLLQFDDLKKPFMYYALIADDHISVTGDGVDVNGSVYAGWNGIEVSSEVSGISVHFSGENIVTRGDIVVQNNAEFVVDNPQVGTAHIWAENVRTENNDKVEDKGPVLVMDGEINIADDLELNGYGSNVTLKGSYNGYNFREDYEYGADDFYEGEYRYTDNVFSYQSQYSSAIMINGEKSRLDLTGLNHLLIAGRTFIKRGPKRTAASDIYNYGSNIMLGESLSLRSDQLAYYVDSRYFLRNEETGEIIYDNQNGIQSPQIDKNVYAVDTGVADVTEYLVEGSQLIAYHYSYYDKNSNISSRDQLYFLNFKDENSANKFYAEYWESNSAKLGAYGADFADAIILDSVRALTLSGDIIYRNDTGTNENPFGLLKVELTNKEWAPNKIYWERADLLARTYRSLEKDLKGDSSDKEYGVREFVDKVVSDDGEIEIKETYENKEGPSLFYELIRQDKFEAFCKEYGNSNVFNKDLTLSDGKKYRILLKSSSNSTEKTKDNFGGVEGGIFISNGSIDVDSDFVGMVMSGKVISLNDANIKVTGNSDMILELIREAEKEYPDIAYIFKDYKPSEDEAGDGGRRISDYLTYENWMKNERNEE